jgi:hypothetical protein
VNVDNISFRRRWTPYKVVPHGDHYRVVYMSPRENLPKVAFLFLMPIEDDGSIEIIAEAVAMLLSAPMANAIPA